MTAHDAEPTEPAPAMDDAQRAAIVADTVRRLDRDRYRAALFAPSPQREHLLSLFAFNIELARVREEVSEAMLGEIRLEWWREALERAQAGETVGHPVADALALARRRCVLPDDLLTDMIDARQSDLAATPMPDQTHLEDYLARTAGTVFQLAGYILGQRDERTAHLARHAGIAFGLTGIMRALPVHRAQGLLMLPRAELGAAGVQTGDVRQGKVSDALVDELGRLRKAAEAHRAVAAEEFVALPAQARPAFLPLALVRGQLRALAKPGRDPLREVPKPQPFTGLLRMWLANATGRIP
ncbi:phytoene/squalene synthase family protein [Dichotomicrobium thermohalophilum]|uniref:Phytoene synthase n=1 Tax=Dichotomicrobium thermohalophilum TaxID=933063 RepID=A0A397Q5D2_9HYPH|nr:phytoene/squalene synthase family protein [Dichotomicrobium thermohalophilum]RIA55639.1 phytoene synthase [Dichotomicrobium thermohalophilum]